MSTMVVPMTNDSARPRGNRRGVGSRFIIATAWLVVLALHGIGFAFFGASSYIYWILPGSGVEGFLGIFQIGIHPRYYRSVALVYGSVAAIHGVFIVQILLLSIRQRQLVLADQKLLTSSKSRNPVMQAIVWIYSTFFTPTGLLGVNGPCFDLLILVREVVETSLQTVQAYRMSQFLARVWLNRFYVTLLVLNCWLMALVHAIFHRTPTTKYFAILLSDFALDFVSSMVVPSVLVFIYFKDAEFTTGLLFGMHWFQDVWVVNAASEFQLVLVISWTDVAIRMVFALSMLGNMNTLKRFINVVAGAEDRQEWTERWNSIVPDTQTKVYNQSAGVVLLMKANNLVKNNVALSRSFRIVFAVWGAIILAFHLSADADQVGPHCVMQARPWGITRPSCKLVLINCYEEKIDGAAGEIDKKINKLYAPSLTKLMFRHCPALEMPPLIQSFPNLAEMKVYNSTIRSWEINAALTQATHPHFSVLMLIRVEVNGGKLPPGLLTVDFPKSLTVFGIIQSNLAEVPDDLDMKWPSQSILHFDTTQLSKVPDSILRLQPFRLVLAGNPMTVVPAGLFELPALVFLDLSYTGISALPNDVDNPSSVLSLVNLDGTNIEFFPKWIDKWLEYPGDPLFPMRLSAAYSPYCNELSTITKGLNFSFSTTYSKDPGSRLMDASSQNWAFLEKTVSCTASGMYRYPLQLEDYFSGMQ